MFGTRSNRQGGGRGTDGAREAEETRIGFRMLGLGFQVVSEVGAGLLGGWLLGWATGWRWSLVLGGVVGIVVGLYTLIRSAWKLNAGLEASDRRARRSSGSPEAGSARDPQGGGSR